jgi:hypothetical protein
VSIKPFVLASVLAMVATPSVLLAQRPVAPKTGKPSTAKQSTETVKKTTSSSEANPASAAAGMGCLGLGCFGWVCLVLVGLVINFIPTMIAFTRGHPNAAPILLVNLLLGWTFIGWVVALVWACTAIQPVPRRRYRY